LRQTPRQAYFFLGTELDRNGPYSPGKPKETKAKLWWTPSFATMRSSVRSLGTQRSQTRSDLLTECDFPSVPDGVFVSLTKAVCGLSVM
jgi:hypothetical protein